jgi:hypothetical protein
LELVAGTGTTSNPMFPNKSSIPPVLFATAGGAEDGTLGAASPKKPSLGWLAEEATMMQHTWEVQYQTNIASNPFNQHPQLVLFPNYSLEKG